MEKTTTMNLRVNPTVKQQAEAVLKRLGIPMATAVDMYLRQISMTGSMPFPVSLPKGPPSLDMSRMSEEAFSAALREGYDDIVSGNTFEAKEVFDQFRKEHV